MATRAFIFALAASSVLAAPYSNVTPRQSCSNPKQRKAWHKLTDTEKKAYLDAELCLMNTPAELDLRGAETVFDELQSIHVYIAQVVHFVGAFLPFHRYFMWAHEHKLETLCGYTGAQPYWEETLDAGAFTDSIIFDAEVGFGGDGVGTNRCVQDGPFAGYKNNLGPGYQLREHCIDRRISDFSSSSTSQSEVDKCMKTTSYTSVWNCIEGSIHGGGHAGVGEEMLNPISSPGDPLFYMHHTWLDKVWWEWQEANPSKRLKDIGGNNKMSPSLANGIFGNRPDDMPVPEIEGDPGSQTTLSHVLNMKGVVPDATIGDVMDTRDMLCYEYVDFRD